MHQRSFPLKTENRTAEGTGPDLTPVVTPALSSASLLTLASRASVGISARGRVVDCWQNGSRHIQCSLPQIPTAAIASRSFCIIWSLLLAFWDLHSYAKAYLGSKTVNWFNVLYILTVAGRKLS